MLDLYKNIKHERLRNGWNQTELAQRIGYSDKSMIAKIETGKVDLPQTKIRQFAEVFGVSESYLMGIDGCEDSDVLSAEERQILEEYRKLDKESKRQLVLMLAFLKDQNNKK